MHEDSTKNYRLIKAFTNGFLDKRMNSYKRLKDADSLCRESIEKLLSENTDIKKLIIPDNEQWVWIKELIVNYTLLKMHHHAILWEIDNHESQVSETPTARGSNNVLKGL